MGMTAIPFRSLAPVALGLLVGACDLGLSASPDFRLTTFPLPNRTHSSITITSVFDHSMSTPYCPDGRVVAYTGETGDEQPTVRLANFGCGDLHAFRREGGGPFVVNGNYRNYPIIGGAEILLYDAHPGYDFRTSDLCPGTSTTPTDLCPIPGMVGRVRLQAAADGIVACSDFDGGAGCPEGPGVVKIQHQDDFHTVYMHMESADVVTGDVVVAGQAIGVAGARGPSGPDHFSPHLHFEVRHGTVPVDPYGWEPTDRKDPYTVGSSYWMWPEGNG